ncbi:MAG: GNAT family N-acetyltransferase [Candidatus Babeliales bacterium]|jgi:ribosomal protein S18 acetylase RimI-like enzyme
MKIQKIFLITILVSSGFFTSTLFSMQKSLGGSLISNGYKIGKFCCNHKKKLGAAVVAAGLSYKQYQSRRYLYELLQDLDAWKREYSDKKELEYDKVIEIRTKNQFELIRAEAEEETIMSGFSHIEGRIRCKAKNDEDCGDLYYTIAPFNTPSSTYISWVGVPSKYQCQGIATEMLHMVEEASCVRGDIKELRLDSVSSAVPLYEKFGFKKTSKKLLGNNGFDKPLFPMCKKIK